MKTSLTTMLLAAGVMLARAAQAATVDLSNVTSAATLNDGDVATGALCSGAEAGRGKVQLWEGGPFWATMNVGAEKPEDYGYYFWWGDTVGYTRVDSKWHASDGSSANFVFDEHSVPTYYIGPGALQEEGWVTADGVLTPEHDAAHVQWGGEWRMPSKQELSDLIANCDWTWTETNGVSGCVVRGRGDYASKVIFLPATGYANSNELIGDGSGGIHWASGLVTTDAYNAWRLFFSWPEGDQYINSGYRLHGLPIRPVQDPLIAFVEPDVSLKAGEYFKATLSALGYEVPTNGTAYTVKAYGLPAGFNLVSNKAVTKKDKKGKTVVVTPAKAEWWIEGVPTAALDYATNPAYLVITANGKTETLPLSLGVEAQEATELPDLALGDAINEQFYLPGVTNSGWTVSGLPTGLKYTAKLLTTKKKKGKKAVSVTTNALPYSVYGKATKAGLFTITAKKKRGSYYETMKYLVLVTPKAPDAAVFGDDLTNITTMAYVPVAWNLSNKMAKASGLPKGLALNGQVIKGTATKPGTYVVTFTKNVTTGTGKKKKTVAKTAQILWTVAANDAALELGFNTAGGVVESGSVGLAYGDLLAFSATEGAKVTAINLPKGIVLANLGGGKWAFRGITTTAGTYLVTVTATLNGKSVTQRIALKVEGLPDWAKGTFNGYVRDAENGLSAEALAKAGEQGSWTINGLATVTVSAAGKISGKFQEYGTNWTFSAASYTAATSAALPGGAQRVTLETPDAFTCSNVVAKYSYKAKEMAKGKWKTVTKTLTREFALTVSPVPVVPDAADVTIRGMATLTETEGSRTPARAPALRAYPPSDASRASGGYRGAYGWGISVATEIEAWQNLWGRSDFKALGKKLFSSKSGKKTLAYKTWSSVEADGLGDYDTLSVKVTTAGALTATYKFFRGTFDKKKKPQYATYTCTTTLIPTTSAEDGDEAFAGGAFVYFAPDAKAGFPGYSAVLHYPFANHSVPVSHEKVQLWEGGPYWATTNIGAEKPEDYGYYFWWGDTVGYSRSGGTWHASCDGYGYYSGVTWVSSTGQQMSSSPFSDSSCPTYGKDNSALLSAGYIDSTGNLAPAHDAAHVHWGGNWRMPTEQELSDLDSNCDWTWTTQNGVKGYVVKGKGSYASASIFLPCAGLGYGTSLYDAGSNGNYWSSVPNSDDDIAWSLYFYSSDHYTDDYYYRRFLGQSVRPVQGFTE